MRMMRILLQSIGYESSNDWVLWKLSWKQENIIFKKEEIEYIFVINTFRRHCICFHGQKTFANTDWKTFVSFSLRNPNQNIWVFHDQTNNLPFSRIVKKIFGNNISQKREKIREKFFFAFHFENLFGYNEWMALGNEFNQMKNVLESTFFVFMTSSLNNSLPWCGSF